MATSKRFLPPIPDGWKIFADGCEVAGVQHHIRNANKFARGRSQDLRFEREPNNRHDPNAIKVMGVYRGWLFNHEVHIGYIPADLVEIIVGLPEYPPLLPRLKCIWVGGYFKRVIIVNFDILIPRVPKEKASMLKPKKKKKK
jgi:hypothetical protein